MVLGDSILLAIVDKLVIGILILFVGLWLNAKLDKAKGEIALQLEQEKGRIALQVQNAISPFRGAAYAKLWALTEELSPHGPIGLSAEKRSELFDALRKWYYKAGNAMYLSINAADLFLKGLAVLEHADQFEPGKSKSIFSALRTQMKVDLGIYTSADARVQIPKAG